MEWEDERTPRWAVHTRLWVKPGSAWVVRSGRGKLAVGLCWPWRRSLDRFGMWRRVRREWVGEGPPIASVALRVQKARTEKRAMTAMQTHTQSCLCPGVLYIDRPERKRGNRGSPARLLSAACPHAVVNPLHLCGRLMPYRPRISGDIRTLSPPAPAIWDGILLVLPGSGELFSATPQSALLLHHCVLPDTPCCEVSDPQGVSDPG